MIVNPLLSFVHVVRIDLEPYKIQTQLCGRDGGSSQPKEGVEGEADILHAVKPVAHLGQPVRKRRRMRAFPCPVLDRPVRDEPCVSAAPEVALFSSLPAGDVALILVGNPDGQAVEVDVPGVRKVEDIFMAVI